ncbi:hypothetical protein BBJ28_00000455 [Nothophytophthora sp. Chile5]|nr:hypothetical protein BBJ28_00000455 [Nothophytophthora sp. Chile5]
MGKERFQTNPFPSLELSEDDRVLVLDLVHTLIQQNFVKYENYVALDARTVDLMRWKHVKTRDDLNIYVRREDAEQPRGRKKSRAEQSTDSDLPVMLSVGTFNGKMDDLMLGVMNPTLDVMRMKASYVHDVNDAAVLAPIIEPTVEDPFLSVVVKWMQRDLPLESTKLIKNRDFVYVEATGILHFKNGERVGYHLMHSIDFPQTHPLPSVVRGNLSICCMFRQLSESLIDNHSFSTLEPGGELPRFLMLPIAAECLLSSTNYEYCGQMMKLAWMLQRRQSQSARQARRADMCVSCTKSTTTGTMGSIGRSTCKICHGGVCLSCKVRKRISVIGPDGKMMQPKISFCVVCVSEAAQLDALDVARDMAKGYDATKTLHNPSLDTSSSMSDSLSDVSGGRETQARST